MKKVPPPRGWRAALVASVERAVLNIIMALVVALMGRQLRKRFQRTDRNRIGQEPGRRMMSATRPSTSSAPIVPNAAISQTDD